MQMISQNSCEYANESTGKLTNHRPNCIDSLITPDNMQMRPLKSPPWPIQLGPIPSARLIITSKYANESTGLIPWLHVRYPVQNERMQMSSAVCKYLATFPLLLSQSNQINRLFAWKWMKPYANQLWYANEDPFMQISSRSVRSERQSTVKSADLHPNWTSQRAEGPSNRRFGEADAAETKVKASYANQLTASHSQS